MKVLEKYRLWHGACHLDDARMAPVNHIHFDGYSQGASTFTQLPARRAGSESRIAAAGTTPATGTCASNRSPTPSTAWRSRGSCSTSTTTTPASTRKRWSRKSTSRTASPMCCSSSSTAPCRWSMGYESLGRLYRGIIEPTLRQYVFLGDGALMTDNVVFDPKKTPEASAPRRGPAGLTRRSLGVHRRKSAPRIAGRGVAGGRVARAQGLQRRSRGAFAQSRDRDLRPRDSRRSRSRAWAPRRSSSSPRKIRSIASC